MIIKKIKRVLKDKKGEAMIDTAVFLIVIMLLLAITLKVYPVFTLKQNLDYFADELIRTAEVYGEVGEATREKEEELKNITNVTPNVDWSTLGLVDLGEKIEVVISYEYDLGSFDIFGKMPVTIYSKSIGEGERYHK